MKRFLLFAIISFGVCLFLSCGETCKNCHAEVMGVKSPPQKVCGEQLKEVEKVAGMVCE